MSAPDRPETGAVGLPDDLLAHALAAKGFMPEPEGELLHRTARAHLGEGPALEIGTYCGKSAIYLGAAARACGSTVFTVASTGAQRRTRPAGSTTTRPWSIPSWA